MAWIVSGSGIEKQVRAQSVALRVEKFFPFFTNENRSDIGFEEITYEDLPESSNMSFIVLGTNKQLKALTRNTSNTFRSH